MIRWTTVFIDRPGPGFDTARDFWLTVTNSTLSPTRGRLDEFVTLLPADGDAHVRLQRTSNGLGGSHLDLHVDDVRSSAAHAVGLGASTLEDRGSLVMLRSPGGLVFCVVRHHGEVTRPGPVGDAGHRTIIDQVCIDIAPDRFDRECEFWASLTGWPLDDGREPEFRVLERPPGMPLRFLLQRRGQADRGLDASCHLDLACDDIDAATEAHVQLGADLVERFRWWTVMSDPAGVRFCLTGRDPDSGLPADR